MSKNIDALIVIPVSSTVNWKFHPSEIYPSTLVHSNFASFDDFRRQAKIAFHRNLM